MTSHNALIGSHDLLQHRRGYPQYCHLLGSDPAFRVFKCFTDIRMRLLLAKQDEIQQLENDLKAADANEDHEIYLGCLRMDQNAVRRHTLDKLGIVVAEYDQMLTDYSRILSMPRATERDVGSLNRWLQSTGSIAPDEIKYLQEAYDLLSLSIKTDSTFQWLENFVTDLVIQARCMREQRGVRDSNRRTSFTECVQKLLNPTIYLTGPVLKRLSSILTTWLASMIALAPILVLDCGRSPRSRLAVIGVSAAFFLSCMSLLTRARTAELFMGGASYAAVLVVFISTTAENSGTSV